MTASHPHRDRRRRRSLASVPNRADLWAEEFGHGGTGECWYCGHNLEFGDPWHIEHQVPRAHGGSNARHNLVIACRDCNIRKGPRNVEQFREREVLRKRRILAQAFDILMIDAIDPGLFVRVSPTRRIFLTDIFAELIVRWDKEGTPFRFYGERMAADDEPTRFSEETCRIA